MAKLLVARFSNFFKCKSSLSPTLVKSYSSISEKTNHGSKRTVGIWLGLLSGMVVGNVALGGLTRLTESGLSMTKWNFFKEIPLLTQEQWETEFEHYKKFPEHEYVTATHGEMSLEKFKFIWWMEYSHRQLSRLIGAVLIIPGSLFWYKGYFDKGMKNRYVLLGALTLFQGLLGWYMVKSGLERKDDPNWVPRVSQYRLTAHLGSAVVLYSVLFWNTLNYLLPAVRFEEFKKAKMIRGITYGTKTMIFFTILAGALVAGMDAGLIYNTYPNMGDSLVPRDIWLPELGWLNPFENPSCAQFVHRRFGEITGVMTFALSSLIFFNRAHLPKRAQKAAAVLLGLTLVQIGIGISNLIHFVPTYLASAHQVNSLFVLSSALALSHALRRIPK